MTSLHIRWFDSSGHEQTRTFNNVERPPRISTLNSGLFEIQVVYPDGTDTRTEYRTNLHFVRVTET